MSTPETRPAPTLPEMVRIGRALDHAARVRRTGAEFDRLARAGRRQREMAAAGRALADLRRRTATA